jgi:hypothetical protein
MSGVALFPTPYKNNTREVSGPAVKLFRDDVVLKCKTTLVPTTLTLLEIPADHWSPAWTLYVYDGSNNASVNNITINAPVGYTINGQTSLVINVNGGGVAIKILSNTSFIGGSSEASAIKVANTVYVMKNGNDATGLIERFDKPFLTIAAARTAAIAGFTPSATNRILISVLSGNYAESIILSNFIDYDLADCVISQTTPGALITDNGVAVDSIVYGKANLYSNVVAGTTVGITIGFGSKVSIYMNDLTMYSASTTIAGVTSSGTLNLYANNIYCESFGSGNVSGVLGLGFLSAFLNDVTVKNVNGVLECVNSWGKRMYVRANNLHAEGGDSLNGVWTVSMQNGGYLDLSCNNITCIPTSLSTTRGWCIGQGASGGIGVIRCNKIECSPTINQYATCINFGATGSTMLSGSASLTVDCVEAKMNAIAITNNVIRQENSNPNARFYFKGRAVMSGGFNAQVISKDTGVMILDDVTLVGDVATTNSITCPAPNNVYVYAGRSNRPVDANTTELVSALLIDPNVI